MKRKHCHAVINISKRVAGRVSVKKLPGGEGVTVELIRFNQHVQAQFQKSWDAV